MLRLRPATARLGDMQTTPAKRRTQMYLSVPVVRSDDPAECTSVCVRTF